MVTKCWGLEGGEMPIKAHNISLDGRTKFRELLYKVTVFNTMF